MVVFNDYIAGSSSVDVSLTKVRIRSLLEDSGGTRGKPFTRLWIFLFNHMIEKYIW